MGIVSPQTAGFQESVALPRGAGSLGWIRALTESPESWDWLRIRLELAVEDAKAGRWNGLVGHYQAFRRIESAELPDEVYAGYRELASLLNRAGMDELSGHAAQVAGLMAETLS